MRQNNDISIKVSIDLIENFNAIINKNNKEFLNEIVENVIEVFRCIKGEEVHISIIEAVNAKVLYHLL
jgi:hypothetical protein